MNAQISLFFCKSTRCFLKFCGLSCWWNEKRKRKCKKVILTTTKTSRKKGEEPHFLCQQNYLQLTLKLSKWKVTTTRTVTFHRHSECRISYLFKMYGCLPGYNIVVRYHKQIRLSHLKKNDVKSFHLDRENIEYFKIQILGQIFGSIKYLNFHITLIFISL